MIRITIDLVSAQTGITSRLARAEIANDATGTSSRGNYDAAFYLRRNLAWRETRVTNFPRKYKNVWLLLREALNAIE